MDMFYLLEQYPDGVFAYYDPPYPEETRTAFRRHNYGDYEWTHQEHLAFLTRAQNAPFNLMISTYPNALYERYLTPEHGWRYIDIPSVNHGGPCIERIYMNYEGGKPFHHTHAGRDYKERHSIKRLAERAGRRHAAIKNPAARLAVLAAILASYD